MTLIYQHIPKTAGTTFRAVLAEVYGNGVFELESPAHLDSLSFLPGHLPEVISGHAAKAYPARYPGEYQYVTFLREPLARLVSHYDHVRRDTEDPYHGIVSKLTLLEFVSDPEHGMDDFQARWMPPYGPDTFVGVVERFDESLATLARILDWPAYPVLHLNKGGSKTVVPEGEAQHIRERYLAEDTELYDQANKNLKVSPA